MMIVTHDGHNQSMLTPLDWLKLQWSNAHSTRLVNKELNQLPTTISVRKKPGKGHSLSGYKAEHPRADTGLGLIDTTIRKSTIMFVQEFLVTKANNY
jgi:hypothetical protein